MKKVLVLLFCLIFSANLLLSCGTAVSDEEIISALVQLAPKARAVYGVVYGDGLAHGPADDTGYCLVDVEAEYASIAEIKAAIYTVFTPEYGQIIENTAFRGVETDEGYIGAKFMERDGSLYVNPSATSDFSLPREFDMDTAAVKEKTIYMAEIVLEHVDGNIEVTLQYMDGKWLIDSPLY